MSKTDLSKVLGKSEDYIIVAPHEICDSCSKPSGPTYIRPSDPVDVSLNSVRNNVIPPDEEREAILSSIARVQSEKNKINREIERVRTSLNKLLEHRDEIDLRERSMKSVFAPIRKLPRDLLEHIFLLCRDSQSDEHGMIVAYDGAPILRALAGVSYHWRFVTNSCSLLWSRFSVCSRNNTSPNSQPRMREFVKNCIRKSEGAPLSFRLECTEIELGSELFSILSENINRWDSVFVTGRILDTFKLYLPPNVIPSFPHLRFLSVRGGFMGTNMFKIAPQLTHLEVSLINNPEKKFPEFPWSQITSLFVNGTMKDDWILKSINHLTTLRLSGKAVITRAVTLPFLQRLELRHTNIDPLVHFIVSNLKTFSIDFSANDNFLSPFLSRCAHSLEELTVVDLPLAAAEDLTLLKHITILSLSTTNDLRRLRRNNTPNARSSDLFPRLETLQLHITPACIYDRSTSKALITMIRSRMPDHSDEISSGGCLRSVTLEFDKHPEGYDTELKAFIRSGDVIRAGLIITCQVKI